MVVCKFYLAGYCRYGDHCRYEHADPYQASYDQRESENFNRRSFGTSVLKSSIISSSDQQQQYGQHSFQNPQQNKPSGGSRYNIHDLMQIVSKDILLAEKGNQWPLSSYSPIRELLNLPDLIDYSPEELRWEYYIANQNGRLPVCQAIVQQLHSNASKVNNKLKKKDTAYSIIEMWLREEEARAQSQQAVPSNGTNGFSSAAQIHNPNMAQPTAASFSFSIEQQQLTSSMPPQSLYTPQPIGFCQPPQPMGFQSQPTAGNIFGGNGMKVQPQSDNVDKSMYSLIEELSQCELDAFRSDRFVFGHIPTKPPPRELCG